MAMESRRADVVETTTSVPIIGSCRRCGADDTLRLVTVLTRRVVGMTVERNGSRDCWVRCVACGQEDGEATAVQRESEDHRGSDT